MTPIYFTSDWHIGAIRSAGTTPDSAYRLRQELLQQFENMLCTIAVDGDLVIGGDLLDTANIPMSDLAQLHQMLVNWLTHTGRRLIAPPGNHDLSRNSTVLSSFQFLMTLLAAQFPSQVSYFEGGRDIGDGVYVLSHVANQDLLEMELKNVPSCRYLMVHTNFANGFAQQADHSLDISEAQVEALPVEKVIFAHEHVGREAMNGKALIVGNPVPSSVSDCLNNSAKRMLKITDTGIEFIETWRAEGDFSEQDWRSLEDRGRFIRVTGHAKAAEADAVVNAIARFRREAKALVITNAVKIEGVDNAAELALAHEEVTNFNVLEALLETLTEDEQTKVKKLLEEDHA